MSGTHEEETLMENYQVEEEDWGEEETFFDDDDAEDIIINEDEDYNRYAQHLREIIFRYNAIKWDNPAQILPPMNIYFVIPNSILPLSTQSVTGFHKSKTLLEVEIQLNSFCWTEKPSIIIAKHPDYGTAYVGSSMVNEVFSSFFSQFYKPREGYRAVQYFLTHPGEPETYKHLILVQEGYDERMAAKALLLEKNDIDKARSFLNTGSKTTSSKNIGFSYTECPLLYLALELCEAFIDIADHCIVCRDLLYEPGVKPTACSKELCQFSLSRIGVGNKVYQELERDPKAADLLIVVFSTAIDTSFLEPAPKDFSKAQMKSIINTLPSINEMITRCHNDMELNELIGNNAMSLLRWILLSNPSQLISLDKTQALNDFATSHQFLTLLSSPTKEDQFRKLKQKHGSMYLFHGSSLDRWHSILRNGLVNATGTKYFKNGSALGPGIYFARASQTSLGYSQQGKNEYKKSSFPQTMNIISLCEVAKTPELKDHGWAHTLTNENAVIVRFAFIDLTTNIDVISSPLRNIPSLNDVLQHLATKKLN